MIMSLYTTNENVPLMVKWYFLYSIKQEGRAYQKGNFINGRTEEI